MAKIVASNQPHFLRSTSQEHLSSVATKQSSSTPADRLTEATPIRLQHLTDLHSSTKRMPVVKGRQRLMQVL